MKTRRLWLLALGIMMLGGIGVGIGLAMGGNYHDGYGIYLSGAGGRFGIGMLDEDQTDAKVSLSLQNEHFSRIEMEVALGDIEIKRGSELRLELVNVDEDQYEWSCADDTLYLSTWEKPHFFQFHLPNCTITLTIPDDMEITEASVEADLGDIDVQDVAIASLDIVQHMGDITVEDVRFAQLKMDQNMGDISYEGTHPGNIQAENDMGDIQVTIRGSQQEYRYELSTDMGEVRFNDHRGENRTSIHGGKADARYFLSLDNHMGDVELNFHDWDD